ncbi:hypothetical protein ROLI_004770 [Roseobacter fucihabitans]|uniref:Uncharacterized protein n=1 Tax=Roseobacter fucihabitans TaxID=1537242 RepID=A0ABZ2BQA5_9RHOB|nr:hypothetical protein [Roseobacter litoralis]MBC6964651.1 hypothetical protein [Roseobacter litoralis]
MKRLYLAATLWFMSLPALAQDWGDLNAVILPALSSSGTSEATFWLPNVNDPEAASLSLAVVYEYIQGSAGNTSIAVGFFVRQPTGWAFGGTVENLFGHNPRDAVFADSFVELTTTTLGPNEPRCCPTMQTRWRVDYQSRTAQRLN